VYKSQFFKNVATIFSGNLINQIIILLTYPIISRLYQPEDFGIFEQIRMIFSVLVIISSLRYESAIIISKEDNSVLNTVSLSILILVTFVIFILISIYIFGENIGVILKNPGIVPYLYWIPPLLLVAGLQQVFYNLSIRYNAYKTANYSNISKSTLNSILRILLGFKAATSIALFESRLLSYFISLLFLMPRNLKKVIFGINSNQITKRDILLAAHEHRDFPIYMSGSVIISQISTSVIPLILSSYFGLEFLGYYAMTNSTLNIPLYVIRNTIQTVFYQQVAEMKRQGNPIFMFVLKATISIFIIGIIPVTIIVIYGPSIYSFILGDQWGYSGVFAKYLLPWIFTTIIGMPVTSIIPVISKQKYFLIFQFFNFSTRLLLIMTIYHLENTVLSVLFGLMIHGIIVNIFNLLYLMYHLYHNNV